MIVSCLRAALRSAPQESGCTIDLTNAGGGGGGGGHRRTQHMLGVWLSGEEATCRSQKRNGPPRSACTFTVLHQSTEMCKLFAIALDGF